MKRLTAKVGEYEKDGQTKGRYVDIGVIMSNDKGEFVLLDPTVNLAGVLIQQRLLNPQKAGDRVMVGVWDNEPKPLDRGSSHDPDDDVPF